MFSDYGRLALQLFTCWGRSLFRGLGISLVHVRRPWLVISWVVEICIVSGTRGSWPQYESSTQSRLSDFCFQFLFVGRWRCVCVRMRADALHYTPKNMLIYWSLSRFKSSAVGVKVSSWSQSSFQRGKQRVSARRNILSGDLSTLELLIMREKSWISNGGPGTFCKASPWL